MRLRRLEVERFRGIRSLDWRGIGRTAALVGPGDSGKSTLLDAVERALSPRWNLSFDDSDFWNLQTAEPVVIRCTITEFPDSFLRDSKFGLALQGFDSMAGVAVPASGEDSQESALVIQLTVASNLEPSWNVIDGEGREHSITARDREALGMLRVGNFVDMHLSWSRGSVLTRLTEGGDAVGAALADASRQARASLRMENLDRLSAAAATVEEMARTIGVAPRDKLVPHLDVASLSVAGGALSLHDGAVPVRRAGLGTRRLLAVAMQRQAARDAGLTMVDEFENGLEPHRIRRLLRVLRGKPPQDAIASVGQLLLTTHSPTVLSELSAEEVFVTRRTADGGVSVSCLPKALGYILPRVPEALLARKVVVVEGATEEGLCIALDQAWTDASAGISFAFRGVAVVDGLGGTQPSEAAGALNRLGYSVALLVDSDAQAKVSKAAGAAILAWPGSVCTEERIATDLPLEAVREMTEMAAQSPKSGGFRSVRDCLADALAVKRASLGDEPRRWVDASNEHTFRTALGMAAKSKGWFKTRELGQQLGSLVAANWKALAGTPTYEVLERLRSFAHNDP
jgi:putative ATP-dependent endonuclease of the OLD family